MNAIENDVKKGSCDVMLERDVRRVLVLQCIVSLLLLFGILAFHGFFDGWFFNPIEAQGFAELTAELIASIYGSALAITGTILSARSIRIRGGKNRKGGEVASELGASALLPVYSGLLNKLVIVGGGIGFGLIVLNFEAIFVVMGYFIVQIAVVVPFGISNGVVKCSPKTGTD